VVRELFVNNDRNHFSSHGSKDLTFKAKDLSFKAKAKDLSFIAKAKDLSFIAKAKDLSFKAKI